MFHPTDGPFYLSRVLSIPPDEADEAFRRLRTDLALRERETNRWTLPLGRWRLELQGKGIVERSGPARPLRQVSGVLRARGFRRIPVELELWAWSDDASEVGLHPVWRRWPPAHVRVTYLRQAFLAIEEIASEMSQWFEAGRATTPTDARA